MDADGRYLHLTTGRTMVVDMLRACRHVPFIPIERTMQLGPLAQARAGHPLRLSWAAIFVKAFAIVSARHPSLRQTYVSFPRPRLFESHVTVAGLAVERDLNGERIVLPALQRGTEDVSLVALHEWVAHCKYEPVNRIGSFRRVLRLCSLPLPVRRFAWWLATECWGRKKTRLIGTFVVSVTSNQGAETLLVRAPCTTSLHYGVLRDDSAMTVRLTFDHRVYDGATAARALAELEDVLLGEILAEVRGDIDASADPIPTDFHSEWQTDAAAEPSPASHPR